MDKEEAYKEDMKDLLLQTVRSLWAISDKYFLDSRKVLWNFIVTLTNAHINACIESKGEAK